MPTQGKGVTTQDVIAMGIRNIRAPQKATAVMRLGTQLGCITKHVETVGDSTIILYRKVEE